MPLQYMACSGAMLMRVIYFSLGCLMVVLGVIGAVTPLLPTTVFLIAAAACFARSSPRLEAWLLDHPRFGPTLRDWRAFGAIARPAKITACAGMALGFAVFSLTVRPTLPVAAGVILVLAGCAAYVLSRPTTGNRDSVSRNP